MKNLSERIKKAFEEGNDDCLVDECPKDVNCGECWCREIQKCVEEVRNKTIADVSEYFKKEWSLDRINSLSDFDKIAEDVKKL